MFIVMLIWQIKYGIVWYDMACCGSRHVSMWTGILLIIGLGVALGVAFGVVLLFGLLYCFRRYVTTPKNQQ